MALSLSHKQIGYPAGYIKTFMRTYAPDFCWMTSLDLLKLLEQHYPEVDEAIFKVSLSRYVREGLFIMRAAGYGHLNQCLYLRVKDKSP